MLLSFSCIDNPDIFTTKQGQESQILLSFSYIDNMDIFATKQGQESQI